MIMTVSGLGPDLLFGVDIPEITYAIILCFLLGGLRHGGRLVLLGELVDYSVILMVLFG